MNKEYKRLEDVISPTTGIFTLMQQEFTGSVMPWARLDISPGDLDLDYTYNHSGQKIIGKLFERLLGEDETITTENLLKLIRIIYRTNAYRWNKLTDTLFFDYDPIENYRMTEEGSNSNTRTHGETIETTDERATTKTGDFTFEKEDDTLKYGDQTTTYNGTETETYNNVADAETYNNYTETHKIAGFNGGGTYEPADQNTRSGGKTNTRSGNTAKGFTNRNDELEHEDDTIIHGKETTTYNDVKEENSGTLTEEHSGTTEDSGEHSLTRSGNIGVTTSQQMIESERLLDMWDIIREVIYKDVDKILVLNIY